MFGFLKRRRKLDPAKAEYRELLEDSLRLAKAVPKSNPNKERMLTKLEKSFSKYEDESPEAMASLHTQLGKLHTRLMKMASR